MSARALVSARVDLGSGPGLGLVWDCGGPPVVDELEFLSAFTSGLSPSLIGPDAIHDADADNVRTVDEVSFKLGRWGLGDAGLNWPSFSSSSPGGVRARARRRRAG